MVSLVIPPNTFNTAYRAELAGKTLRKSTPKDSTLGKFTTKTALSILSMDSKFSESLSQKGCFYLETELIGIPQKDSFYTDRL